jgi:hypothetical protein
MKKIVILLAVIFSILMISCKEKQKSDDKIAETSSETKEIESVNKLEVYAFHGTRQCETCKNMKANTKAALETFFADELASGKIIYKVIDVDDEKNEAIAEKFEATGTALMINKIINGNDNIEDWSEFAFEKANNSEVFQAELKEMIKEAL